ncbi:MAG: putative metalloprotease CJM1_0395 family protein [Opitutales bacterium]
MEIGGPSNAYTEFYTGSPYGAGGSLGAQSKDDTRAVEAGGESKNDFDGNPYYDDPKHSDSPMPLLGYRRDDPLEMGVGSDAGRGISGLGESLGDYAEGAISDVREFGNVAAEDFAMPGSDENLQAFRSRDQEVRAHEMAHLAAAGGLARGGMQLSYQVGPDGKPYAVGGSVQIDTSEGATPQETIIKAAQIEAAATAPANPSPQDLKVAAQARRMAAEARQEIAEEQRAEQAPPVEGSAPSGSESRAEVVTRAYGVAVAKSTEEPAFAAIA